MTSKYDIIGKGYDTTRQADSYLSNRMSTMLGRDNLGRYLDIGCGTGNYTSNLAIEGRAFIGMDPSPTMLAEARRRHPTIDWRVGSAESIDLPNDSIDAVLGSLTIHHWTSLSAGLQEVARVLKPLGHFVLFTSTPAQMKGYWLCHYFPKMMADSMKQMPSMEAIESGMKGAGLTIIDREPYSIKDDLEDCFLYIGKHSPDRYLDPALRKGISSFSSLANASEVAVGLSQLEQDIDSGKVKEVINSYQNTMGDYIFIKAALL